MLDPVELVGDLLDGHPEKIVLVAEVGVEGAAGDAGGARDLVHGQVAEGSALRQLERDAQHVGDLIPGREGLEVFSAHESMGSSGNRGATMRDAATGEVLWSIPATRDTGRAASGDIDPRYEGNEGWAVGGTAAWDSRVGQLVAADGDVIGETIPAANFLAWFDGDPLREIVDHEWDAATSTGVPIGSEPESQPFVSVLPPVPEQWAAWPM